MVFTVIVCMSLIGIAIALNQIMNTSYLFIIENFGEPFYGKVSIFTNASNEVLEGFCPQFIESLKD